MPEVLSSEIRIALIAGTMALWLAWPHVAKWWANRSRNDSVNAASPSNRSLATRLLLFEQLHAQLDTDGCVEARKALESHVLIGLVNAQADRSDAVEQVQEA